MAKVWSSIYPSTRPAKSRSLGSSSCAVNLKSQVPMLLCKATSASTPKMIKRRSSNPPTKISPYQGPRSTTLYRQGASPDNQPNNRACLRRRSLSRPTEVASSPEVAVMPVTTIKRQPRIYSKFHKTTTTGARTISTTLSCACAITQTARVLRCSVPFKLDKPK